MEGPKAEKTEIQQLKDEIRQLKTKLKAAETNRGDAKAKDDKGEFDYWHSEVMRISDQLKGLQAEKVELLRIQANNNAQQSSQAGTSTLFVFFCFVSRMLQFVLCPSCLPLLLQHVWM
jgi:hypothetical protein